MVLKVDPWHADRHNSFFQRCQAPPAWMMSAFYMQYVCVYAKHIDPKKWKTEKLEVDALLDQHVMTDALL